MNPPHLPSVLNPSPSLAASSDGLEVSGTGQDIGHEEQPRGTLDALDGHEEALQRESLIYRGIGHHVGTQLDLPAGGLQDEHLEEVRGHCHVILSNNLVLDVGLPISLCPVDRPRHMWPGSRVGHEATSSRKPSLT